MGLIPIPNRGNGKEESLKKAKKSQNSNISSVQSKEQVRQRVLEKLGKYKDRYITIFSIDELDNWINECYTKNGVVAIDTETTGLSPMVDKIVGISLHSPNMKSAYIPINHVSTFTKRRISSQLTEEQIAPYIERLCSLCLTIWHNAKFDIRTIQWNLGIKVKEENIYWCTLTGAHLLNENEPHGLKYLYNKYILKNSGKEDEIYTFSELFDGVRFDEVPIDIATIYASHDPEMTYELYEFQKEFLFVDNIEENNRYSGISYVFNYIEMPIISVTINMEDNGIYINKEYAKSLSIKYNKELEDIKEEFNNQLALFEPKIQKYMMYNPNKLKMPFNIASPSQLAILLYDIIGVKPLDIEKPRATGEEILERIDLPICKTILKYRGIAKLLDTYIDKLPNLVDPKTNRLHGNFNPCGTVTGRFSSSNPNLQNIPSHNKEIRKMFVASEGNVLVGSDYSQQEPRILAHLSGDKNLIEAYKSGLDIYSWVASMVYKVPYEECLEFYPDGSKNVKGKERRGTLKAIILGIMYSKGTESIATDLNITKKEAEDVFNTFFETFPKVKKFIDDTQQMARTYGYVNTAWGRKRRLPEMQLPKYEFSLVDGYVDNFDPFDFGEKKELKVNQNVVNDYTNRLNKAFGFNKKNEIINEARNNGIIIKDNSYIISTISRQCVNSVIQGSAGDMVKASLINIYESKELKELGFKLLLTIHDEIIGECPIENAKEVSSLLTSIMINTSREKIEVPMKCDAEITKEWTGESVV